MKIRYGFVSNSSSSSFTCNVCYETASGWDMSLEEAEMFECQNGHTICQTHAVDNFEDLRNEHAEKEARESLKKDGKNKEEIEASLEAWKDDYYYEFLYGVPAEMCSLCGFSTVSDSDELNYYRKLLNATKEKTSAELREKFGTFDNFKKFLRS